MTTRNQWIADRVAVATDRGARPEPVIGDAKRAADAMEASGCAPWQTTPPAPTASVEAEVSAVAMIRRFLDPEGGYHFGAFMYDARAILARLDAKGGAK